MIDVRMLAVFEARAEIVKALAPSTRLIIVGELSHGERCVCDLRNLVGAVLSTVSTHPSVLKATGIVRDDKRGLQVFYSLRVPSVLSLLSYVEAVVQTTAADTAALLRPYFGHVNDGGAPESCTKCFARR